MFYFKATIHAKPLPHGVSNPTQMELYLPSTTIMGIIDRGNFFEILVNPDMVPKVNFQVGNITASIRKTANATNEIKFL